LSSKILDVRNAAADGKNFAKSHLFIRHRQINPRSAASVRDLISG
jgi:hypothetical protein